MVALLPIGLIFDQYGGRACGVRAAKYNVARLIRPRCGVVFIPSPVCDFARSQTGFVRGFDSVQSATEEKSA